MTSYENSYYVGCDRHSCS